MKERTLRLAAILFIFSVASTTDIYADIYKHVDKNGRITYSNKAVSGSHKLPEDSLSSAKSNSTSESTNNYPIVSSDAQAKRDLKRRQILENELAIEKKLLVNAKQSLINTKKNAKVSTNINSISQEDLTQFNKEIKNRKLLHESNIMALRKELGN